MASSITLIEVKDRKWLNGFAALWRKESRAWLGTRSWLVKIFIWIWVLDGMLVMVLSSTPVVEGAETGQAMGVVRLEQTALSMYFLIAAMLPTFGVIVRGQDAIIQERQTGTAAWVLSKPVSRAAFILAKLFADAWGVLVTMVLVQGIIAYAIYKFATGISLSIPGWLAGLGMVYLFLISVQALTLMLGTLVKSRGQLLGISTAFVAGNILASIIVPGLGKVMPSYMFYDFVSEQPSMAVIQAQGQPLPTVMPILITAFLAIFFIIIAIVRFEHEEF